MKYIYILLGIVLLGCDPIDSRLKLMNNSDDEIYYSISKVDSFKKNPLHIIKNDTLFNKSNRILPKSFSSHSLIGLNEWEYFINRDCEDSLLRVYFFEKKLILNSRWDTIVKKQEFSKKIEIKVVELDKIDWEIYYPPLPHVNLPKN